MKNIIFLLIITVLTNQVLLGQDVRVDKYRHILTVERDSPLHGCTVVKVSKKIKGSRGWKIKDAEKDIIRVPKNFPNDIKDDDLKRAVMSLCIGTEEEHLIPIERVGTVEGSWEEVDMGSIVYVITYDNGWLAYQKLTAPEDWGEEYMDAEEEYVDEDDQRGTTIINNYYGDSDDRYYDYYWGRRVYRSHEVYRVFIGYSWHHMLPACYGCRHSHGHIICNHTNPGYKGYNLGTWYNREKRNWDRMTTDNKRRLVQRKSKSQTPKKTGIAKSKKRSGAYTQLKSGSSPKSYKPTVRKSGENRSGSRSKTSRPKTSRRTTTRRR